MIISPSVLSADFVILKDQLDICKEIGIKYIHFDIMDGIFVGQISFGPPVLKSIANHYDFYMDAHMMVTEPIRYIKQIHEAGANSITVHFEACSDLTKTIMAMKDEGIDVGLSINPDTPVSSIVDFLPLLDYVLVMGVNPGFGGQKIIESCIDKVRTLYSLRKDKGYSYKIQFDGGANKDNTRILHDAGVDILICGSAFFKGDIIDNYKNLTY